MTPSPTPPTADTAPTDSAITDYDRAHLPLYLRLLDAAADGAPWQEAARVVLGLDPAEDAARARRAHDSHLARARWLSEHGYRDLLRRGS
ncbi:MAG: DNA -binding domain-containing protein [Alphaproteobacteria bacterium]